MASTVPFDASGSVSATLQAAFDAQGPSVLRHTSALRNALAPIAGQAPRESGVLVMAADAGVADMLSQQVSQQGIDTASAIRLSSGMVGQRTSLDPDAATWATTLFARVLGLVTDLPDASPAPTGWPAEPQGPVTTPVVGDGWPAQGWGGAAPLNPSATWPAATTDVAPTTAPAATVGATQGVPPAPSGPPSGSWPNPSGAAGGAGWSGAPGGADPKSPDRRPLLLGTGIVAVVAILGYFGVAAGAHLPPFSKSSPGTASANSTPTTGASATTTPPTTAAPTTTVAPTTVTPRTVAPTTVAPTTVAPTTVATPTTVAAQSRTVAQLMPADIKQATSCRSYTPPVTGLVGLDAALECTDTSLPGGTVFGLQFDSPTHYATSAAAFNTWLGFDSATASTTCPPDAGNQGGTEWHDDGFPPLAGQRVECLTVGTEATPAFTWFYPDQDVIFDAQSAAGSSLLSLSTWWTDHGDAAGAA